MSPAHPSFQAFLRICEQRSISDHRMTCSSSLAGLNKGQYIQLFPVREPPPIQNKHQILRERWSVSCLLYIRIYSQYSKGKLWFIAGVVLSLQLRPPFLSVLLTLHTNIIAEMWEMGQLVPTAQRHVSSRDNHDLRREKILLKLC